MQANLPDDFEVYLENALAQKQPGTAAAGQARLHAAMAYALLGGGKRLRARLVLAACTATSKASPAAQSSSRPAAMAAAAALEAIHAFSLVHDDLPCMDNDDLRRGRPTTHRAFDEAMALLAGDALQTLGFEWLLKAPLPAEARLQAVTLLAEATGLEGMAGGQAIDIEAVGLPLSLPELARMHRLKTGALIRASILIGAICGCGQAVQDAALEHYASALGLGYQVVDDVLDATASTEVLGKTAGKDAVANKPTFVSLLGLEPARAEARRLRQESLSALQSLPWAASALGLEELTHQIFDRAS